MGRWRVLSTFALSWFALGACQGTGSDVSEPAADAGGTADATGTDTNTDVLSVADASEAIAPDSNAPEASDANADVDDSDAPACNTSTPPSVTATTVSNPAAANTSNSSGFVLHKELNGFSNYGAADGAADVLYTGQTAAWTFTTPVANIRSANVVLSVVADDNASLPLTDYAWRLWSGMCEYDNPAALPHGAPFGSRFTNWVQASEPASLVSGGTFTVTVSFTGSGNWIAVDWIELQVTTQ